MTASAIEFTAAADARLTEYLNQVRGALSGVPDVNADEVEADIRDHVNAALRPAGNAATLAELEAVLAALGPPAAWRPAVAPPAKFDWWAWLMNTLHALAAALGTALRYGYARLSAFLAWAWEAVRDTLKLGPEDWRLAYLCLFGLLLAVPTLGVTLVAAYCCGRAAVELARRSGRPLGARRWLVYPPVVLVSGVLLLATAVGPVVAAAGVWHVQFVEPAETYREAVRSVAADGTVTFRPGVDPERWRGLGMTGVAGSAPDRKTGVRTWGIPEPRRLAHERTLAVLDRVPVFPDLRGVALTAHVTLGAALAWLLVLAGLTALLPETAAAIFCPLLDTLTRPRAVNVALACAAGLTAWLAGARALLG